METKRKKKKKPPNTQHTPFMLDTSRHPQMGLELDQPDSHVETVNEFKDHMEASLEEAKSALAKEKDDMAKWGLGIMGRGVWRWSWEVHGSRGLC